MATTGIENPLASAKTAIREARRKNRLDIEPAQLVDFLIHWCQLSLGMSRLGLNDLSKSKGKIQSGAILTDRLVMQALLRLHRCGDMHVARLSQLLRQEDLRQASPLATASVALLYLLPLLKVLFQMQ